MAGLTAREEGLVNEQKLVGHEMLADPLIALLDVRCRPDPEYPLGLIRSVYFDTPDGRAYGEKSNGDHLKQKVRIRWYGGPAEATAEEIPIFVEVKCRIGSARQKIRCMGKASGQKLSRTPLDDPFFPDLLRRHAAAFDEFLPTHLIPTLCISYERRRYVCPQTGGRAAVDRSISADRTNPVLLPATSSVRLAQTVCELKNEGGEIPNWVELLYGIGFRLRSFSKYGECMAMAYLGGTPL